MTWRDKYHINKFHSFINLDLNSHISYLNNVHTHYIYNENRKGLKEGSKILKQGNKRVVEYMTLKQRWEDYWG